MNAKQSSPSEAFFERVLTFRHFMTGRRLGLAAIGLLALSLLLRGADPALDANQSGDASPLPVETITAKRVTSFSLVKSYTGSIAARRTSDLGFERSARVIELLVDEGEAVHQGDVLAKLDTRRLLVQQAKLQAQRTEAIAVLAELKSGPRQETIAAATAEVADLNAQVELQARNLSRTQLLIRQNAASRERLDEYELGVESSRAKLTAAQKRLDELTAGTRKEQIDAQQAVVAQLSASLSDTQIEIDDSTLLAPFAGTVSARFVDEGAVVSPAQVVLQIVESQSLEVRVGLPPTAFNHLNSGDSFNAIVDSQSYLAEYDRAIPQVNFRTRTRIAVFRLLGIESRNEVRLVPGQIARISLTEQTKTDGFWLPTHSLVRSTRGLWAVYVAEPDNDAKATTVQRRDLEILHTEGERSLVRGLLEEGDQIIISGTHRVVPGQKVQAQPFIDSQG